MPSGGFRNGAGRPRKNANEKKLEGKTVNAKTTSVKTKPNVIKPPKAITQNAAASKNIMAEYFSMAMKECGNEVPSSDDLRAEIEAYISSRGCEGFVAPQTITDYVLNRQGFLACECMNRKVGRMTKDMKLSPYVTAGQAYYKAMQGDFNLITQIINRYSPNQNDEKNEFLEMLRTRGF